MVAEQDNRASNQRGTLLNATSIWSICSFFGQSSFHTFNINVAIEESSSQRDAVKEKAAQNSIDAHNRSDTNRKLYTLSTYESMPGLMDVLNKAHTGLWSEDTMLGTESYAMHSTMALCKKLVKLLSRRKPNGLDLYLYRMRSV